ncbi:MAG TPA: dihydroorotase [Chitinophagaceae bacterium]|nr:dihydroorotase [Chitinophagaceae bacterium]
MQTLIKQAVILQKDKKNLKKAVDILVENNKIKKIADLIPEKEEYTIISGKKLFLSAGWIDIFADFSEPGYEYRETIEQGLLAAKSGGFKQVFLLPNTEPSISTQSEVLFVKQKAQNSGLQVHPIGAVTKNLEGKELAEMYEMKEAGAIAFSEGWNSINDANLSLKALEFVKAWNGIIIHLPYLEELTKDAWMHEGVQSTLLGMAGIPEIAETIFIKREIELAKYAESRIHFTGISAKKSVEIIRNAKKEGVQVTCSVTPYHLLWNDKELETYNSLYKIMPPLRTEEDRQALVEAVMDGTIDCISSHHRPANWDEKTKEFEYANWGIAGIEYLLPLVLKAIPNISAERLAALLVYNAQEIFGIKMEDDIAEGVDISKLTLFDMEDNFISQKGKSKAYNQPEISENMLGRILL